MCIDIHGPPRWLVKNLFASVGDMGLIPGSGRSPGERMATHSSILAWKIPWTEGHGGLHGVARVGHNLVTKPPPPHWVQLVPAPS